MIIRNCNQCGKEIKTKPSLIKRGDSKFCDKWCRGKSQRRKNNVVCKQCGVGFGVRPSYLKRGEVRFCSNECFRQYKRDSVKKKGFWIDKSKKNVCKSCGKDFYTFPSRARKYCGHKCFTEKNKGNNHYGWLGDNFEREYPHHWTESLRRRIRERDRYVCQICNEPQGDLALDVHHIDYDKNNCTPDNLISLCHPCHTKTNFNRKKWMSLFGWFGVSRKSFIKECPKKDSC